MTKGIVVQGDLPEDAWKNAEDEANYKEDDKSDKKGEACWEGNGCTEPISYRVFGYYPQGMAETFLCSKHTIQVTMQDKGLMAEEL